MGQDGLLALEAVEQDQRIGGDVNGDGARGLARADGQAAVGGMAGGGKDAVFINRADAALGGPGEAGVLREQGEVVLIGLRGQLDARAGGDAQLGERAAFAEADLIRRFDYADLSGGVFAADLCADGHGVGGFRRGQDRIAQLVGLHAAAVARDGDLLIHGKIIRIDGGGAEQNLRAREHAVAFRAQRDVVERAARLIRRNEEDVVRHGAQAALGGGVVDAGIAVLRQRDAQSRRAAAVQAQRGHAAELDHALRDLRQARADGVALPAAVDGVEHKAAVGLLTDGGARRSAGLEPLADLAVLHELIERADHVVYVVPALVRRADGDGQRVADRKRAQQSKVLLAGEEVRRQDVFALGHGGVGGLGQDLVHGERQRFADAQAAVDRRADHVIARGVGAGGATGVEIVGVEVDAAVGVAHLIDGGNGKGRVGALDLHCQRRSAEDGCAVRAEADGIVARGGDAQHAIGHHRAERRAVERIVVVAVDARDHTQALLLQPLGGGGDGARRGGVIAVGDDGRHARVRRVDDVVFLPQVGEGVAPERALAELGAAVERCRAQVKVVAQRLGGERRRRERQQQGKG